MEDKLTLFRQQAAIISRKKESTAEKLNDVRVELNALEEEVKDKKSIYNGGINFALLPGTSFARL